MEVVIAGGAARDIYFELGHPRDVDVYLLGFAVDEEEEMREIVDKLVSSSSGWKVQEVEEKGSVGGKVGRIMMRDGTGLELIPSQSDTVEDLIAGFDLTICEVYHDGEKLEASLEATNSWDNKKIRLGCASLSMTELKDHIRQPVNTMRRILSFSHKWGWEIDWRIITALVNYTNEFIDPDASGLSPHMYVSPPKGKSKLRAI
jgi:hypothetical protein